MRKIPIGRQVIYLIIIFLLFSLFLEGSYRSYQYLSYDIPVVSWFSPPPEDVRIAGATLFATGDPFMHYLLNSELSSHTPDHFRVTDEVENPSRIILCLGGSSTYGSKVTASEAYPNQLQRVLNRDGESWKVLNAGVPGWSLPHHISRYVHDLRYRESSIALIILYIGYNDVKSSLLTAGSKPAHAEKMRVFPRGNSWWISSRFLLWLFSRVERLAGRNIIDNNLNDFVFHEPSPVKAINRENLKRFEDELDFFLNLLKADGVPVLIVLQDSNGNFPSELERAAFNIIKEKIMAAAVLHSTVVVDMNNATRSQPEYFADVIHMTGSGNRVRAEFLGDVLRSEFPDE